MGFIEFRLTAAQLPENHNLVMKGTKHLGIARMDAVVRLLARCLSEVKPEPEPIDPSFIGEVVAGLAEVRS